MPDSSKHLARCAALVAQIAFSRKLTTVTDLGSGELRAMLGPVFTHTPDGRIAIAAGVLEQLTDPAALLRTVDAEVLICSSPWAVQAGDVWSWDFDGYRALIEQAGFRVLRHEAVGLYQVILADRTGEPREDVVPAKSWTVPRYAIIPTHNRPARLLALVASLAGQCDRIVIIDNASSPPVDAGRLHAAAPGVDITVLFEPQQPPHLSRFWNVMLDNCTEQAKGYGEDAWDIAILNDDALVPAGWYDACSTGLRGHDTAVIAHTTPTTPALLTELHNDPANRMTPHAFVIRGELGTRADEAMRWWYFDSDLDQRARQAGGVLSVDGPRVVNSLANTTTVGPLAEQAQRDAVTFEQKWANR